MMLSGQNLKKKQATGRICPVTLHDIGKTPSLTGQIRPVTENVTGQIRPVHLKHVLKKKRSKKRKKEMPSVRRWYRRTHPSREIFLRHSDTRERQTADGSLLWG
jgi:hypothetical protein